MRVVTKPTTTGSTPPTSPGTNPTVATILGACETQLQTIVTTATNGLQTMQMGRINPAIFQTVQIAYYGGMTSLHQLASLQTVEARLLVITPYDRTILTAIEQALLARTDLEATVTNDGHIIRVRIPDLTSERRMAHIKRVHAKNESTKIALRAHRRDTRDALSAITSSNSRDTIAAAMKELDTMTARHVTAIDTATKTKVAELKQI